MTAIITGAGGSLAYFNTAKTQHSCRAFSLQGDFRKPLLTSFAGLSAFAANSNHAPTDFDGAVTWDAGVDLLFRISDAR